MADGSVESEFVQGAAPFTKSRREQSSRALCTLDIADETSESVESMERSCRSFESFPRVRQELSMPSILP